MGVRSFYWWLVRKYPKIVVNAWEEKEGEDGVVDTTQTNPNGIEFDNLYLDMKDIIYPCFRGDYRLSRPTTFNEVFSSIFECIDRLFCIVRPRKVLYIAIDGVASTAKMDLLRRRRFLTAKRAEARWENSRREFAIKEKEARWENSRREFAIKEKVVLPKMRSKVSDPNVIAPGTKFMDRLSKALKCYIRSRLKSEPGWKDIEVILSDANVPGEGKHKIMSFIRVQRNRDGYNSNTRHCMYGGDPDLVMLALATHEVHFSVLREDASAREQQASCILSPETSLLKKNVYSVRSREWFIKFHQANGGASLAKTPYRFLNIWTLREYLELDMTIAEPPKDFLINFERIVDDFIFLCFFLGNDFLPELPLLGTHEGPMDLLIAVYKKEFKSMGGYLIDTCRLPDENAAYIKFERVEQLILAVGSYEDKIFKKRSEIQKCKLNRILREILEARGEEDFNNVEEDSMYQPNPHSLEFNGLSTFKCSVTDFYKGTKEFIQKLKELLRWKMNPLKNGNLLTDKVNLGSEGWKAQYYKEKFSVEKPDEIENKRKEIVQKYVEGLCWVLRCYFEGVCSWSWYYNHHFSPFASDFKGLGGSRINFQLGTPFKPLAQLMAVLPPRSAHALPKAYRTLMTCSESNIIDFYPTDFEVDTDGETGLALLKFIDEKRLLLEIEKLENKLKVEEVRRNVVGHEMIFVWASHDLGLQVSSICCRCVHASGNEQIVNKMTINSEKSGLSGFLMRCGEQSCMDDGSSLVEGMEYTAKNDVVCAMFENPQFDYHIPEPPKNVTMPEKTITEADIKERVLWHEYNGRQSRENRLQNSQRYAIETGNVGRPTSSDPSLVQETWKGAGRGDGRGKGSLENSNYSLSSETCRGIQTRNGGFGQLRNSMWAHRSGSWQYNTPPDVDLHGRGRGKGNGSFEEPMFGQTSVTVRRIQDRNGGFNTSGNGSRADRSDNWRSTSQLPEAPTYQGQGRGCSEPSSSSQRW